MYHSSLLELFSLGTLSLKQLMTVPSIPCRHKCFLSWGTTFLPSRYASWRGRSHSGLISLPHLTYEVLDILRPKYLSKLPTSLHLHCHHTDLVLSHLLSGLLQSPSHQVWAPSLPRPGLPTSALVPFQPLHCTAMKNKSFEKTSLVFTSPLWLKTRQQFSSILMKNDKHFSLGLRDYAGLGSTYFYNLSTGQFSSLHSP